MLLVCPHHGFEKWRTVSFFYDGLKPAMKKLVETMCHGEFLAKNEEEAEEYFEWLAEHTPDWAENGDSSRSVLHAKSLNQLRSKDSLVEKY